MSVGLLPHLVNTKNRKKYTTTTSAKSPQKEDYQLLPVVDNNSPVQLSVIVATPQIESPKYFKIDDNFETGVVRSKMMSIFDNIFFEYNFGEFCSTSMMMTTNVLQQIKENKAIISIPPASLDFKTRLTDVYFTKLLETFFPGFDKKLIGDIQKSINMTIGGISLALNSCFEFSNLLDQMTKIFLPSDRYIQAHLAHFPDMDKMAPIMPEQYDIFSPVSFNPEEEMFMANAYKQMKDLIDGDDALSPLIYILSLFSPFNVEMTGQQKQLVQHYQQKATMLIYSHLMSK